MMEEKRLSWVDFLKGIAICAIIMIHANGAIVDSPLRHIAQSGWSGVQIFLILSAFLTLLQLEKKTNVQREASDWNWLLKRMLKLVPMYYCMLLVGILFFRNQNVWLGSDMKLTPLNIVFHLLFLHTLIPYYANSILWVEWYLGDYFLFSLFTCLFYKKLNSWKKSMILVLVAIGASIISVRVMNRIILLPEVDRYIWTGYVETYNPIKQFPAWTLGGFLFYMIKDNRLASVLLGNRRLRNSLLVCVLVITCVLIKAHSTSTILFALVYTILIYIVSYVKIPLFVNKIFAYIGRKSYGIYLSHYLLILVYEKISIFKNVANTGIWLVKYVVVVATALLITILYERIIGRIKESAKRGNG